MEYEIKRFTVVLEDAYHDDENQTATLEYGPRRVEAKSKEDALRQLHRIVGEERRRDGHNGEYVVFADPENVVPVEDANQTKCA